MTSERRPMHNDFRNDSRFCSLNEGGAKLPSRYSKEGFNVVEFFQRVFASLLMQKKTYRIDWTYCQAAVHHNSTRSHVAM